MATAAESPLPGLRTRAGFLGAVSSEVRTAFLKIKETVPPEPIVKTYKLSPLIKASEPIIQEPVKRDDKKGSFAVVRQHKSYELITRHLIRTLQKEAKIVLSLEHSTTETTENNDAKTKTVTGVVCRKNNRRMEHQSKTKHFIQPNVSFTLAPSIDCLIDRITVINMIGWLIDWFGIFLDFLIDWLIDCTLHCVFSRWEEERADYLRPQNVTVAGRSVAAPTTAAPRKTSIISTKNTTSPRRRSCANWPRNSTWTPISTSTSRSPPIRPAAWASSTSRPTRRAASGAPPATPSIPTRLPRRRATWRRENSWKSVGVCSGWRCRCWDRTACRRRWFICGTSGFVRQFWISINARWHSDSRLRGIIQSIWRASGWSVGRTGDSLMISQ